MAIKFESISNHHSLRIFNFHRLLSYFVSFRAIATTVANNMEVRETFTEPIVGVGDDKSDSSSTNSQQRRKRQRTDSKTTLEEGVPDPGNVSIRDVNEYGGWSVPEASYQIPILGDNNDKDLEPRNFYDAYVRRRRPVVIRRSSLPRELEHLNQWMSSNEDMLQRAGDETIMVEKRSNQKDSFGRGNEVSMSFSKFVELLQEKGDTMHYLTTQDVEANRDGRPELMSPFMKELYAHSDNNKKSTFPLQPSITGNLVPQNINLWMGNSEDGASSGLHHDYHDNLYVVLRGTKHFRLYSPADTHNMYTRGKLFKVHTNGRINYEGEITTAYGADPASYAAAQAQVAKEEAEKRLVEAEKAVEEGKPGAEEELERAEAMLDEAMEAILDAEQDDDDGDDEDAFCLETAKEEDVVGMTCNLDELSASSGEEDDDDNVDDMDDMGTNGLRRIVDKTIKNPNNFSRVDPSILDDAQTLQSDFPKILDAKSAFCECHAGDILYLPASWFHEVRSSSKNAATAKGHMAFNYWFHPPDAENDFETPYTTDFWPNDFKDRFKDDSS